MTAILALLAKIPILAWILIAALVVIGWQRAQIRHERAQVVALQGVANTLHDANQTNLATIDALKATVADWAQKCTAEVHEARRQAQLSVQADAKRNAEYDVYVKKLHAEAKHDVYVKNWLDMPVPAAAVRSLQQAGSQG